MVQIEQVSLNQEIEAFLLKRGALKVGFATQETIKGGPPSTDLTYVLPEARSAICFAMPFDRDKIRLFLSKQDFDAHQDDKFALYLRVSRTAKELAKWLRDRGYPSVGSEPGNIFRKEIPGWRLNMRPDLSFRYIAVRSGLCSFGWSGNVGMKGYGTAILLGNVVTAAELEPTDPLPPEESFCDGCKLCWASCPTRMFDKEIETKITLGGFDFSYGRRNNLVRCQLACGGFSGLDISGKWSTWSPGRYKIPEDEKKLPLLLARAVYNYSKWPNRRKSSLHFQSPALEGVDLNLTCGNCQLVCWGNKEDTRENRRLLRSAGCVVQREDGEFLILPPDEAAEVFDAMDPKHKRKFQ